MFPLRLYATSPATGYSIVLRPPVAPSRFSPSSAVCFCGTPTSSSPSFLRISDYPIVVMMNLLGSKLSTNPNVYYIKSSALLEMISCHCEEEGRSSRHLRFSFD
ncbi:hypothetical protein LXL04_037168 [Taraxacum kok-saghyz]